MKTRSVTFLLALALFAAGCAGPSRLAETPTSLEHVNDALEGRTASIRLKDGRRLMNLRTVRVEPDTTYYHAYGQNRSAEQLPTSDIAQIRYRTDSGARDGFLIGALPGVVLGIAGLVSLDGSSGGAGIVGYTALVGGGALALFGGLLGAVIGNDLGKHEVIVYDQPLSSDMTD